MRFTRYQGPCYRHVLEDSPKDGSPFSGGHSHVFWRVHPIPSPEVLVLCRLQKAIPKSQERFLHFLGRLMWADAFDQGSQSYYVSCLVELLEK